MGAGVVQHTGRKLSVAHLRDVRRTSAFMKTDGNTQALTGAPQGIIVGIVPADAIDDVRPQEDGLEAQLLDAAPSLRHSGIDIMWGDMPGAKEPIRMFFAEVIHPVVVSPADGGRSATQILNLQSEIAAIDAAIADELKSAAPASPAA